MSAISKNLPSPPDNFSTTLSSGISNSDLSVPLNSVAGLGLEGIGVIFSKDANGNVVASSIEFVHWTNISGNNLTLTNTGDRGLTGSASGAQAHNSGSYFEVWVSKYYYDSQRLMLAALQSEHNDDGSHKDITGQTRLLISKVSSTPAAPATGYGKIYMKQDDKAYFEDPAGNEREIIDAILAQTLANKILTNPKITDGGGLQDSVGNSLLLMSRASGAVNSIMLKNSIAAIAPLLAAIGSDTDIPINLVPKGAGKVQVGGNNTLQVLQVLSTDNATDATFTDQDTSHNVLELAITPKSTSSKILAIGYTFNAHTGTSGRLGINITRSTSSGVTNGTTLSYDWLTKSNNWNSSTIIFLDAPASVSTQYYALVMSHMDSNVAWHTNQYGHKGIILIEVL